MKKTTIFSLICFFLLSSQLYGGLFDNLMKGVTKPSSEGRLSDGTIVSGLKEALSISTEKAVTSVSKVNGYYENPLIKILVPEKLQQIAGVLRKMGFSEKVDEFELSMNRAIEMAAPKATSIFVDSIKEMSFEDAKKILNGGDTAATGYFKEKTSNKLHDTFRPIVSDSMNKVNVTKSYKDMVSKYSSLIPFSGTQSVDLDEYVTSKGLDGLFLMMAEEEKKIRNNPLERTTDLLKKGVREVIDGRNFAEENLSGSDIRTGGCRSRPGPCKWFKTRFSRCPLNLDHSATAT